MFVYMYVVCVYVCLCVCMYVACVYVCLCIYVHIVCMCVYVYMCVSFKSGYTVLLPRASKG